MQVINSLQRTLNKNHGVNLLKRKTSMKSDNLKINMMIEIIIADYTGRPMLHIQYIAKSHIRLPLFDLGGASQATFDV